MERCARLVKLKGHNQLRAHPGEMAQPMLLALRCGPGRKFRRSPSAYAIEKANQFGGAGSD
jgi:hypothetical protein